MEGFISDLQITRKELNKLPYIDNELNNKILEYNQLKKLLSSDDKDDIYSVFLYLFKLLSYPQKLNIDSFVYMTIQKLNETQRLHDNFYLEFIEYYDDCLIQLQVIYDTSI